MKGRRGGWLPVVGAVCPAICPAVCLAVCLTVMAVGTAIAQPRKPTIRIEKPTVRVRKPIVVKPTRIDVSRLTMPGIVTEDNLEEALIWGRPGDVFGSSRIVTEDKLPARTRFIRGQDLQRRLPITIKTTDPSVQDTGGARTIVQAGRRKVTLQPGLDVMKDPGVVKLLNVFVNVKYIVAVAHGRYNLYFSYSIVDVNKVKLPLRFVLTVEGPVAGNLAYLPYTHEQGPANNLMAYMYILTCGSNMPFVSTCTSIGVKALDADGKELGTFTKPMTYRFAKRYVDITRDDIKNYMTQMGVAQTTIPVPASKGVGSVVFQDALYLMEPMLVLIETNQGNYAKALLDTEAATDGRKHIAVWDARCYAKNQSTFNATPGMKYGVDSNTEYISLFGRGGYIFWTGGFDFDRDGHNPEEGQSDLANVCGPDSSPETQVLIGSGAKRIAY